MKTITKYACEVCSNVYEDPDEAKACEDRGRPANSFPVGMIFGMPMSGVVAAIVAETTVGHRFKYGVATREPFCFQWTLTVEPRALKTHGDGFWRMVARLGADGVSMTVWDGLAPVPLGEYLSARAGELGKERP